MLYTLGVPVLSPPINLSENPFLMTFPDGVTYFLIIAIIAQLMN